MTPPGQQPAAGHRRWTPGRVALALAVLVVVGLAAYLVIDRGQDPDPRPGSASASGPASDVSGEWSGEGSLTDCAGFDDEDCAGTRRVTLTIDCSGKRCAATPFDSRYGRPPLRFADGGYRAVGPLPPEVAPTCGGAPTTSGQWRLELAPRDGRLRGSYAESTIQGFDCGATWLRWLVTLERG